jgi:photosystem II stability/assembly factor-like uncharacterized protein
MVARRKHNGFKLLLVTLVGLLLLSESAVYAVGRQRQVKKSHEDWQAILALFFFNANDGWLVDLDDPNKLSSTICRTEDGGRSWKAICYLPFPATQVRFVDPMHAG